MEDNKKAIIGKQKDLKLLKDNYGMEITPFSGELDSDSKDLIPILKDGAAELASVLQGVPDLLADKAAYDFWQHPVYSITFDGKDVSPDMLVKRKNGAYMANQKGEKHGLGKYADIELMDKGKTNIAIIADSVFSAASAATSTYYLKNIDDKLEELQETLNEILAERKLDKQSRILGDLEMLEQIMGDMNAVKNNPEMKSFKLLQVAGIQREANSNIKYYEESLRKSNGNYLSGKVTGKGILKVRKEMQEEIYFYRISLQLYSLSKMIEVVLSDNFDIDSLRMIREDLAIKGNNYEIASDQIITAVYHRNNKNIRSKLLKGISGSLCTAGHAAGRTPLKKIHVDEKLTRQEMPAAGEFKINQSRSRTASLRKIIMISWGSIGTASGRSKLFTATGCR